MSSVWPQTALNWCIQELYISSSYASKTKLLKEDTEDKLWHICCSILQKKAEARLIVKPIILKILESSLKQTVVCTGSVYNCCEILLRDERFCRFFVQRKDALVSILNSCCNHATAALTDGHRPSGMLPMLIAAGERWFQSLVHLKAIERQKLYAEVSYKNIAQFVIVAGVKLEDCTGDKDVDKLFEVFRLILKESWDLKALQRIAGILAAASSDNAVTPMAVNAKDCVAYFVDSLIEENDATLVSNSSAMHYKMLLLQNRALHVFGVEEEFLLFCWILNKIKSREDKSFFETNIVGISSPLLKDLHLFGICKMSGLPQESHSYLSGICTFALALPSKSVNTLALLVTTMHINHQLFHCFLSEYLHLHFGLLVAGSESDEEQTSLFNTVLTVYAKLSKLHEFLDVLFSYLTSDIPEKPILMGCRPHISYISSWMRDNAARTLMVKWMPVIDVLLKWISNLFEKPRRKKMQQLQGNFDVVVLELASESLQSIVTVVVHSGSSAGLQGRTASSEAMSSQLSILDGLIERMLTTSHQPERSCWSSLALLADAQLEFKRSISSDDLDVQCVTSQSKMILGMLKSCQTEPSRANVLLKCLLVKHLKLLCTLDMTACIAEPDHYTSLGNAALLPPSDIVLSVAHADAMPGKEYDLQNNDYFHLFTSFVKENIPLLCYWSDKATQRLFLDYYLSRSVDMASRSVSSLLAGNEMIPSFASSFSMFDNTEFVKYYGVAFVKLFASKMSCHGRAHGKILAEMISGAEAGDALGTEMKSVAQRHILYLDSFVCECSSHESWSHSPTPDSVWDDLRLFNEIVRKLPLEFLENDVIILILDLLLFGCLECRHHQQQATQLAPSVRSLYAECTGSIKAVVLAKTLGKGSKFWKLHSVSQLLRPMFTIALKLSPDFEDTMMLDVIKMLVPAAIKRKELDQLNALLLNHQSSLVLSNSPLSTSVVVSIQCCATVVNAIAKEASTGRIVTNPLTPECLTSCLAPVLDWVKLDHVQGRDNDAIASAATVVIVELLTGLLMITVKAQGKDMEDYEEMLKLCACKVIERCCHKVKLSGENRKNTAMPSDPFPKVWIPFLLAAINSPFAPSILNSVEFTMEVVEFLLLCFERQGSTSRLSSSPSPMLQDSSSILLLAMFEKSSDDNQCVLLHYLGQQMLVAIPSQNRFIALSSFVSEIITGSSKAKLPNSVISCLEKLIAVLSIAVCSTKTPTQAVVACSAVALARKILRIGKNCLSTYQVAPCLLFSQSVHNVMDSSMPTPAIIHLLKTNVELVTDLVFLYPSTAVKCVASLLSSLTRIMSVMQKTAAILTKESNEEAALQLQLHDVFKQLVRLYEQLAGLKTAVSKYAPYIIRDFIRLVTSTTLPKDVLSPLVDGIYAIMEICSDFEFSLLQSFLNSGSDKVYFQDLYSNFTKYYHFEGKA